MTSVFNYFISAVQLTQVLFVLFCYTVGWNTKFMQLCHSLSEQRLINVGFYRSSGNRLRTVNKASLLFNFYKKISPH